MAEHAVRLVVLGDGATGKTGLVQGYLRSLLSSGGERELGFVEFLLPSSPPLAEALPKKLEVSTMIDDLYVTISFVDDDTSTSTSLHFADADIFLVCFSVVQPTSFDNIRAKWVPQIQHYNPGRPFLVVGTKIDLRTNFEIVDRLLKKNHSPIDFDQGRALAIELKASEYKECSATTLDGVRDIFEDAVRVSLGNHKLRRNRNIGGQKAKKSCDLV